MRSPNNIIGKQFGRLTVRSYVGSSRWKCLCACGKKSIVSGGNLKSGSTKSCGCRQHTTHGLTKTPEYKIWAAIKYRCLNKNDSKYEYYGGRGITICERWKESFKAFYKDMGKRPTGYTIEREDNDKGYFPENCFWATRKEQNRNTRRNVRLVFRGEEHILKDWAIKLEMAPARLHYLVRELGIAFELIAEGGMR